MDTHGGAGDGFTGSRKPERGPMCGCRPIMTGRGVQGEQFAHIAARLAVCAMQLLLTYSWGGSLASKGEYREQSLLTSASAAQWVSQRVVSAQAWSAHTMEAWGSHILKRGHRDN